MRWVYISPHLDDAALSAGGLIYEQTRAGLDVEIWTILCGFPPDGSLSPFAQLLHHNWGIPNAADVLNARRAEDLEASRILGATSVHFDFLDCIYRRNKNGDWLYSYVFVPPHEDEDDFSDRIAESISARLKPDDKLVCHLGLGSHVDHILVRRAVERLNRPLLFYADIPYLFRDPQELGMKTAGMKANIHSVSETGLNFWLDAIGAYASQISSLFDSQEDMQGKIRSYWAEVGGIRLWSASD